MTERCEQCGGELRELGKLGRLLWLRCRACGWDQSIEVTEEDSDDGEE